VSPLEFDRLQRRNAFVSDRLLVPKVLHAEFVGQYGDGADAALRGWYQALADGLSPNESIDDVFAWLRVRFRAWMQATGRVKKAQVEPPSEVPDAEATTRMIEARRRLADS
jgi:hypothetical protein